MNVKQTKQKDRRKTLYIRFKYLYHMKGPDNFTKWTSAIDQFLLPLDWIERVFMD